MTQSDRREPAPADRDAELVTRARQGDRGAFNALILAHQDRVYAIAHRLLGNHEDAMDAAQEAFVKCYRSLSSFDGRSAFYTWLFRIAVNAARSLYRSRRRTQLETAEDFQERAPADERAATPAEASMELERRNILILAIDSLDGDSREIIVLRDLQELSYEEVAAVLDCPLGSVKSRLSRARQKLRQKLESQHPRLFDE